MTRREDRQHRRMAALPPGSSLGAMAPERASAGMPAQPTDKRGTVASPSNEWR